MPGRGPAPKQPGERRRYNQPARGEWVDLEPLEAPILPPPQDHWPPRVLRLWRAWRESPVTSQYGIEDIEAIYVLADTWDELSPADQDRRMNQLGLTPKGKRDLRWRTPNEVKTIKKAEEKAANVRRLRTVPNQEAG